MSSVKPLHIYPLNFVWMFLGLTSIKFVEIGVSPLYFLELLIILCIYLPILKKKQKKPR